jgi:hypothetical protein
MLREYNVYRGGGYTYYGSGKYYENNITYYEKKNITKKKYYEITIGKVQIVITDLYLLIIGNF